MRLKRCQKSDALNQEAVSLFWKSLQDLKENICDEDLFGIIFPAIWPAALI